jgi:hypothetical protein
MRTANREVIESTILNAIFGKYLNSAWTIFGHRPIELIRTSNFKLIAVREVPGIPAGLIEAEFEAGYFNDSKEPVHYKVRFDTANEWSVVESEASMSSPPLSHVVKIDYRSYQKASPKYPGTILLKDVDGKESYCEFERVAFGPVDENVFRIETYGLKDISKNLSAQPSYLHWGIIAASVIASLIIGAMVLKKVADRR